MFTLVKRDSAALTAAVVVLIVDNQDISLKSHYRFTRARPPPTRSLDKLFDHALIQPAAPDQEH